MNNHQRSSATSQIYAENDEDKEINRYARRTKLYVSKPRISNIGHDFMLKIKQINQKVKSHRAALISVFVALSRTPAEAARPRTKG